MLETLQNENWQGFQTETAAEKVTCFWAVPMPWCLRWTLNKILLVLWASLVVIYMLKSLVICWKYHHGFPSQRRLSSSPERGSEFTTALRKKLQNADFSVQKMTVLTSFKAIKFKSSLAMMSPSRAKTARMHISTLSGHCGAFPSPY